MGPIRILLLLFLFYMLYRLLTGGRQSDRKEADSGRAKQPLSHDVLVEDPVCHIYIPQGQATTLQEKGMTHYFCSETCRSKYIEMLRSND